MNDKDKQNYKCKHKRKVILTTVASRKKKNRLSVSERNIEMSISICLRKKNSDVYRCLSVKHTNTKTLRHAHNIYNIKTLIKH